ncbi:anthranilate synthase component I family protein [Geothermobacter hydrogeniphilus]|uniref:Aminodeoxychorismate synthase component I n=1 Tax=Geothermobacter hydrogeniphilus TaxID=1969733 RepID=A0A1X0YD39_9BACT|nr:anthranilate synthase component I family protein [Geothermobacter hydrogeniphilus]ORJ62993.1 aminodeoxychorismate synthase component I [Geothermobacter hydrogeniphilus]
MPAISLTLPLSRFDPLAVQLRLAANGPGFLESANLADRTGRYSIVPLRVRETWQLDRRERLVRQKDGNRQLLAGDCWQLLQQHLEQNSCTGGGLFPGGFFGLFGYDLAGSIEHLPRQARRDLPIPELWLCWVDLTAVYDHRDHLLTLAGLDDSVDLAAWGERVIDACREKLPVAEVSLRQPSQPVLSETDFRTMVDHAKDYIRAGDIYQANLSCRFDARLQGPSWALYQHLRKVNPAPFACLLRTPGVELISASPERLVSLRDGIAETRPIAGTRPRGYTPPEDHSLGEELLAHPKERAEHIMLLDLERNDLGKVCRVGSVEVDELMVLERYSHVTHIVSNVRGELRPECGPFELVRAMFPGGTITGVPKKRCMEIIDELEPTGRGSYTGSVGYLSANGNLDLNILIRGFQRCGDHLSYQVGAGIVADSDPQREWQECLAKGAAMAQTLEGL